MTMHHHFDGRRSRNGDDASLRTSAVESQIAALGGAIVSRRRHRDQMLERASESVMRSNSKRHSAKVVAAISIGLILISPLISALTRIEAPIPQTAERANAAALRHAETNRMSFDWALVDIFDQFRAGKRTNQ